MSTLNKKFYITTPIYYVNAAPHIGHTYTTVAADALARFHRMTGDKTFFLTGTDEHGAKVKEMAIKAGKEPREFADEVAAQFQFAWDELNISNDRFIRTTEKRHKKAVQNALQFMYDKGDIYKGAYEGLYCRQCEQYKSEKDLVDGMCPDHKIVPEKMSEECYMFRLSKYQDELLKKIEKDELRILPEEKKNEILSFYKKNGLQDISFSRKNVKWGIPLPWDKSHTAYVWADAFLNYLTGLGWTTFAEATAGKDGKNKISSPSEALLGRAKEWWPPDVQLMSKDILRVHATIWPAMLLSLGLPLPKIIFVHGFFLIDGQKMSKSLGNVIAPSDLVKRYGVDGARYLLMSATTFGHDGDVSWKFFDEKYNADLANGLGNLVARSVTLAEKLESANIKLQKNIELGIGNQELGIKDENSLKKINKESRNRYRDSFSEIKIDSALDEINSRIKFLDLDISALKPWELIKNRDERVGFIIYSILEHLRHIAWMLWPFMPETAEKIWESLGLEVKEEMKKDFKEAIKWGGLPEDVKVNKKEALFPRL